MMLTLGKVSSAVILSCLLCVAWFSTGAFAQSASASATHTVAVQGVNAVQGQRVLPTDGWEQSHGHVVLVTRAVHWPRFHRVVRVRTVRIVKTVIVTRTVHWTHFHGVNTCHDGCRG